jgi:ferredoxin-nitrite reductase
MNKIEEYKKEKDGLEVLNDLPRYTREGWEAITDGDRERLKWLGVFFRRQTPGHFMMRIRISKGISNSVQLRNIAEIGQEFGKGFIDITTRQQIQLRWFKINQVMEIWDRLQSVGLLSLQTGMDNIRNVVGCPVAGITPNELFDAAPVAAQFTNAFLGNQEYTNLPRKFNVAITGCLENCIHTATQDIALTPAIKEIGGTTLQGFNVAVGGKQGSGGFRPASSLDVFVPPDEAAELCRQITLAFRDHGFREARNKARLAFLIDAWGVERFRQEVERRVGHPLLGAGKDSGWDERTDHIGIFPQKQPGLNYAGLAVPVGRISTDQLLEAARLADIYGNGEMRLTISQNLIIPNISDENLTAFQVEPLLQELRHDSSEVMRGLVSCTGIDYCHFALIDTKGLATQAAHYLEKRLGHTGPLTIHWSGCPNACGNHAVADIGLLGKKVKINGKIVDAVDVFLGEKLAATAGPSVKSLENVPCDQLPQFLEQILSAPVALTARAAGVPSEVLSPR